MSIMYLPDDLRRLRLGPAYPNANLNFTMESVTVVYNSTEDHYVVTMSPHDCGYEFDDLALDVAQVEMKSINRSLRKRMLSKYR